MMLKKLYHKLNLFIYILLSGLFVTVTLSAQNGFEKTYELDAPGSLFSQVLYDNDTLLVLGQTAIDSSTGWYLTLTKMDTLGNVLEIKEIQEPNNYILEFSRRTALKKSSDGGYYIEGRMGAGLGSLFVKLDQDLNLQIYEYYFDAAAAKINPSEVHEAEDGYIITGFKDLVGGGPNVVSFAYKLDMNGQEVWRQDYDLIVDGNDRSYTSLLLPDGKILMGAATGNPDSARLYFINSDDGEIDHFITDDDHVTHTWGLLNTSDGGFIRQTREIVDNFSNYQTFWHQLIKYDSDGEVVWTNTHGPLLVNTGESDLKGILDAGDGNYITYGHPKFVGINGMVWKIDGETGDSLWVRVNYQPDYPNANNFLPYCQYYGATVLPSGSIICVGKLRLQGRDYAWMVKMDKNGCITDDDCPGELVNPYHSVGIDDLSNINYDIQVLPNPVEDVLILQPDDKVEEGGRDYNLIMYDLGGKIVLDQSVKMTAQGTNIDVKSLRQGLYIFLLHNDEGKVYGGKIMKR